MDCSEDDYLDLQETVHYREEKALYKELED